MTPSQLRVRAEKNLSTAEAVLESDPDNASNLAGQAAELALKARYCTRHGIKDFPSTPFAVREAGIGKLLTHDLDELLQHCNGLYIPRTSNIDWDRVSDWSNFQKYDSVGTISLEKAAAQVEETGFLVHELSVYELSEGLTVVRSEVEDAYEKLFEFFILEEDHIGRFDLVYGGSWVWTVVGEGAVDLTLRDCVHRVLAPDLIDGIAKYRGISGFHSLEVMYRRLDQTSPPGLVRVTDAVVSGHAIRLAYLIRRHREGAEGHSIFEGNLIL